MLQAEGKEQAALGAKHADLVGQLKDQMARAEAAARNVEADAARKAAAWEAERQQLLAQLLHSGITNAHAPLASSPGSRHMAGMEADASQSGGDGNQAQAAVKDQSGTAAAGSEEATEMDTEPNAEQVGFALEAVHVPLPVSACMPVLLQKSTPQTDGCTAVNPLTAASDLSFEVVMALPSQ